jgi:hypothetical protein
MSFPRSLKADSLPTRTIITADDSDLALTPALNVLPHLRNGLARPALSTSTKISRAALAAFPAMLVRILPGGKRGGAKLVARKPQNPAPR